MAANLQYLGSFQNGRRIDSENPLEEVWSRVAQHGSADFLREIFGAPTGHSVEPFIEYMGVRVRQSVEFREAARRSTLLTSPLSLYYSFLNLTRACLCMHSDLLFSKGHGLAFQRGKDLLSSEAKIAKGTFTDYLDVVGFPWRKNKRITLSEALSRIVEVRFDYTWPYGRKSLVVPVKVNAYHSGSILLNISKEHYDLSSVSPGWASEFPSLAGCCRVRPSDNALEVTHTLAKRDIKVVENFCSLRLEPDLIFRDEATWYLVRQTDSELTFPRPAYYFIALFILGSVVRYEPELMLDVVNPDSHLGWLLERIVRAAERFFPQLMLSWLHNNIMYF